MKNTLRFFTLRSSLFTIICRELHQVCLDESIDLAIHHAIHIRGLIVGAVVFHAAVIEDRGWQEEDRVGKPNQKLCLR